MANEEKQLLLIDLCARLPYGVIVDYDNPYGGPWDTVIQIDISSETVTTLYNGLIHDIETIRPYLRPMSSMTEEESREYRMFIDYSYNDFTSESTPCVYVDKIENYINWLNAHHFDFRGLIERGLALEAPEGMYKTE